MQVTGRIKVKSDTQVVSERFKKRDFVLTIDESSPYPQHVTMQLTQDRCELIDNVPLGVEVEVYFNLRGREWVSPTNETKYFNTIDAWSVRPTSEHIKNQQSAPAHTVSAIESAKPAGPISPPIDFNTNADDDLPF